MEVPRSRVPAAPGIRLALMATDAKFDSAVLAPPSPESVWSPVLVPEIVASAVSVRLPPSFTVRAAFTISKVRVLPAVKVVEDTAAIVTSKAAEVSLTAKPVKPVSVPPAMLGVVRAGEVENTMLVLLVPVEPVAAVR